MYSRFDVIYNIIILKDIHTFLVFYKIYLFWVLYLHAFESCDHVCSLKHRGEYWGSQFCSFGPFLPQFCGVIDFEAWFCGFLQHCG